MSTVEDRVKQIVAERFEANIDTLKSETSFVEDLGADSLDTVELVMSFETEFSIDIPDEEAEKITNLKQAVDYISANMSEEAA